MQLLSILPLPVIIIITIGIALLILGWAFHSGRKQADKILKVKYSWDHWNQVWYYIVSIREGDAIIPGVQLSNKKEGDDIVEVYSFRDYSLRGAIDHFKGTVVKKAMWKELSKKISG